MGEIPTKQLVAREAHTPAQVMEKTYQVYGL